MTSKLIIKNQFGEESLNIVGGSVFPLSSSGNIVLMTGATAPTSGASGTGDNIAGKGSLYVAQDTGALYSQQGAITAPSWVILEAGSASVLATALTGLTPAAGTLAASDTVLGAFNKIAGNVAAHQADSVAADTAALVVDFNALLAKLQAANLMA